MTDVPLEGVTLVTGPSDSGKTRLTAAALDRWVDRHGPAGVVVLDFAPELERDGRVLGGRISRFTSVPDGAWHGVIDAHAPRAEGGPEGALDLARDNAARARTLLDAAPDPRAAFVNDATIPFQADGDPSPLRAACAGAEAVVCNALDGDEWVDDPVSRNERRALDALRGWADRTVRLTRDETTDI
ncbi:MAG: hypothetical protein ABEJ61_05455 [Haloferacaceae archaeon]